MIIFIILIMSQISQSRPTIANGYAENRSCRLYVKDPQKYDPFLLMRIGKFLSKYLATHDNPTLAEVIKAFRQICPAQRPTLTDIILDFCKEQKLLKNPVRCLTLSISKKHK